MEEQVLTDSDIVFKFALSVSQAAEPLRSMARDLSERASLRFALGAVVTRMDQVVKEMMDEANKMGMIEDAKEIAEMHAQEEKEEQDAKPR